METSAEFDPKEVVRIVEDALRQSDTIHASFLDVQILEKMYELLPKYLNPADVSYLISQIRADIYSSFKIPATSQLHRVITNCTKCSDEFSVDPQTPKWNVVDPDLVIVALNPSSISNYGKTLIKGLTSAGFKSDRCCLTYVTRCPVGIPSKMCLQKCVSYLHTEIHALNPKLIVTLGLDAYVAISGDAASKQKDILGKIKWFGLYPILQQYSLGYVENQVKKNPGSDDSFINIFQQAYRFIYS